MNEALKAIWAPKLALELERIEKAKRYIQRQEERIQVARVRIAEIEEIGIKNVSAEQKKEWLILASAEVPTAKFLIAGKGVFLRYHYARLEAIEAEMSGLPMPETYKKLYGANNPISPSLVL